MKWEPTLYELLMRYVNILPRVLLVDKRNKVGGFGTYRVSKEMPFPGGLMVGDPGPDFDLFFQSIVPQENGSYPMIRAAIRSQPNHFALFLGSFFSLAVQQYGRAWLICTCLSGQLKACGTAATG